MDNKEQEKSYYEDLSDKDKILVSEYLSNNFNQSKAYMVAYEVENYDSARTMSSRKFADVNIKLSIKEKIAYIIDEKDELTRRVIEEYKKIAFSDIRDLAEYDGVDFNIKEFENIDTSIIKEITCKKDNIVNKGETQTFTENLNIKLYDKKSALDSISKYLGLFVDKAEIDHNINSLPDSINIKLIKPE